MRRAWTLVILTGLLLCTLSACTEDVKQGDPNSGLKDKPELKQLPPPGNPGGGTPKQKGGSAPKAE